MRQRRRDVVRCLGLLAVVLGAILGWSQGNKKDNPTKGDQDYTIRTTSRLVLLDVSVKDPAGGYVSGLTKDNFKVYEN